MEKRWYAPKLMDTPERMTKHRVARAQLWDDGRSIRCRSRILVLIEKPG
jgi:hypothetical protein